MSSTRGQRFRGDVDHQAGEARTTTLRLTGPSVPKAGRRDRPQGDVGHQPDLAATDRPDDRRAGTTSYSDGDSGPPASARREMFRRDEYQPARRGRWRRRSTPSCAACAAGGRSSDGGSRRSTILSSRPGHPLSRAPAGGRRTRHAQSPQRRRRTRAWPQNEVSRDPRAIPRGSGYETPRKK